VTGVAELDYVIIQDGLVNVDYAFELQLKAVHD